MTVYSSSSKFVIFTGALWVNHLWLLNPHSMVSSEASSTNSSNIKSRGRHTCSHLVLSNKQKVVYAPSSPQPILSALLFPSPFCSPSPWSYCILTPATFTHIPFSTCCLMEGLREVQRISQDVFFKQGIHYRVQPTVLLHCVSESFLCLLTAYSSGWLVCCPNQWHK